jgi:uncharacterized membrane protein
MSVMALLFYLTRIFRFLKGSRKNQVRGVAPETIDSRLQRAKKATVIEVKTVRSRKQNKPLI